MVDENLKTLRAIHGTLMLLCATVFAVALCSLDYSKAISELKTIAGINLEQFKKDSYASLNAFPQESNENMKFAEYCHFSVKYELNKIGQDVLDFNSSRFKNDVCVVTFDDEQINSLQSSQTIGEYRQLLIRDIGVDWVWFNPSRIAEAFFKQFQDPNIIPRKFWGYPTTATFLMNSPMYCPSGTRNFCGNITLILMFTKPELATFPLTVTNPPIWQNGKLVDSTFQKWLDKQGVLKNIVKHYDIKDIPYSGNLLFPNLRPLWNLIKDETPEEAIRTLEEKMMREVSLLGIPFDTGMVVIVAPIATVIIYLLFISHIIHLKRINNDGEAEISRKFPWLLLFPGRIYSLVSWVLILIPSLTLFFLVYRYWYIDGWKLVLGIIFAFFSFILACCCLREINHLRKRVSVLWLKLKNHANRI